MYRQRSKYHNRKLQTADGAFDSKKEYARWQQLKIMQEQGYISALQRQITFPLIPSQKDVNGKTIERPCVYKADFVYKDADGTLTVEDAKGMRTDAYIIKRKLMLHVHGIRIKEV